MHSRTNALAEAKKEWALSKIYINATHAAGGVRRRHMAAINRWAPTGSRKEMSKIESERVTWVGEVPLHVELCYMYLSYLKYIKHAVFTVLRTFYYRLANEKDMLYIRD